MSEAKTKKAVVFEYLQGQVNSGIDVNNIKASNVFKELSRSYAIGERTVDRAVKEFKEVLNGKATIHTTNTNTTDSTIYFIQTNRDVLEQMINTFKDTTINSTTHTNILPTIDYSGKAFKDYKYSLTIELHKEFENYCKLLGLSQRRGLHMALVLFNDVCKGITDTITNTTINSTIDETV